MLAPKRPGFESESLLLPGGTLEQNALTPYQLINDMTYKLHDALDKSILYKNPPL